MGMLKKNRFLAIDVDGTLTDGKIYVGESGELFKAFNVKDGCGIHDILPEYEIIPIIITARYSKILEQRCRELGIKELYQNIQQKKEKLEQLLEDYSEKEGKKYSFKDVSYIGDDILDLPCMEQIKREGGLIGCPLDAVESVKELADFVSKKNGGDGAVRDFIDWLVTVI